MPSSRVWSAAILSMLLLALTTANAKADNWPRFRGPNGSGVAADKGIPTDITPEKALWKVDLASGHSSPVVWDGKIFLQTAGGDGDGRALHCLSLKNGETIWKKATTGTKAKTHQKSSLASGTAATDGKHVFITFWNGAGLFLAAYDFAGNEKWKKDLGSFTSQHGAGHSPVIIDNTVFLANDQDGTSKLHAFKADSGEPAWAAERVAHRTCYSTPIVMERPNGTKDLLVASTTAITAYDAAKGTVLWNWDWAGNKLRTVASPILGRGMVFVTSGDGSGARHFVAVKLDGAGDAVKPSLAWEETKAFPYVPSLLLNGEYLFSVRDGGIAACHIAATGEEVWVQRLKGTFSSSPILIDGKVYAINEGGDLFVYEAGPAYKLIQQSSLGEPVFATPAVADGKLLVRGKTMLYCFGAK